MDLSAISDILGVGASVASGGIFGVVGSVLGYFAKKRAEQQRQTWEEKKWNHELKLLDMDRKFKSDYREHEMDLAQQDMSAQGLLQSIAADASIRDVHTWVNDIKSLFRPGLTLLLCVLSALMFNEVLVSLRAWDESSVLGQAFTSQELLVLVKYMVYTTFFATSTAIVWFFGDRALAPPGKKNL